MGGSRSKFEMRCNRCGLGSGSGSGSAGIRDVNGCRG